MMWKVLYVFLVLMTLPLNAKQHEVSICAIFQNEAPYLKEWIEYHKLLGVKHFWLYNNNSTDRYLKVLSPYIKKGEVELFDWPSPPDIDWTAYQMSAYNHCLIKARNKTKWLAVIDIDEFIVPMIYDNLPQLLKYYEGFGGLQIFWQFFGTSWVKKLPPDKTLVETLLLKAPKDFGSNYNFKSIVQPNCTSKILVHGAEYIPPWHEIFPHGTRGGAGQPINIDYIRINHYWTRTEDYFLQQKIPRRERLEGVRYTPERILQIFQEFNQEPDEAILRFVPALRNKLGLKSAQ